MVAVNEPRELLHCCSCGQRQTVFVLRSHSLDIPVVYDAANLAYSSVDQLDTGFRPVCSVHYVETVHDHKKRFKIFT